MTTEKDIDIFKSYMKGTPAYVGGKSRRELSSDAEKIYKLSSNENALGSSPKAIAAIQNNLHALHEYPDRTDTRIREALVAHYNEELDKDQFMATPSGSEMIDLIIRAFVGEGLECIASSPCFQPYFMFSGNHGARTVDVPLIEESYDLDIQGILDQVGEKTRIIFITSPNNPTGGYVTASQLQYLMDRLPDHVIVVLDEVYKYFVDAEDYITALPFIKKGYRIIGLNSLSKSHGLAGMRLGYAYGPLKIMNYIRQIWKPFLMNTLAIEAMIAALSDNDFIEKTHEHIVGQRRFLHSELDRMAVKYWKSQGNFIMIKPPLSDKEFETEMLQYGIMIRPVSNFGAVGCVRVTIGTKEANLAFIQALENILHKHRHNQLSTISS